jgi:hypothetical protein
MVTRAIGLAVALSAVGCASSAAIENGAYEHLARAQAFESQGDYYRASEERAAANKQFDKARWRAYQESYYGHPFYY